MKNLFLAILLCCGSNSFAQFVVTGGSTMTLQPFSLVTVDDLIIQPGATGLTISNTTLTHTPVAESVNSGSTINSVYVFSNPIVFNGFLTLKYNDADLNGNTAADLEMVYSASNAPITWITTTGTVVNTVSKQIQQIFAGTTISRISATSNTVPLALQLLSFDAKKDEKQTASIISWSVANIADIQSFVVERGADGKAFSALGKIVPNADPSYQLRDEQPLEGWNFYRLKMIDLAGVASYSAIKPLQFEKQKNSILSVFPNPVISQVTIHTTDPALMNTEAMVLDMNGKTVKQFKLISENTSLSAEGWIPGTYIIKLQTGQTFKVVKK